LEFLINVGCWRDIHDYLYSPQMALAAYIQLYCQPYIYFDYLIL